MKKVGIITISRINNYGAGLQSYALQKKIQLLGYDAEMIDYLYFKHKSYKQTSQAKPLATFSKKEEIKQYVLYRIATPVIENFLSLFHRSVNKRLKNFAEFHQRNIRFSKQYRSIAALYNGEHPYDVFIVGSDQVWNPDTGTSLAPYFLDFAPEDRLKISYASSFGVSSIDPAYHLAYRRYFENLNAISVREEDGVKLVKEITGRNAERVLDPTLLLTKKDWLTVVDKRQDLPDKYVLIYTLHDSPAALEWAHYIRAKFNLKIIRICKRSFANKKEENVRNIGDAGPAQFVELFSNASFVVTNSFHGTAFSVNFNIPFVAVLKIGKENNSRISNFLNLVKLNERIVNETHLPEKKPADFFATDFSVSNQILERERESSIHYLLSNLNSNK
ncbi:MAG: polysaccharide pyruvyl transferase family protein [Paludibacteraceae bacterium]